MNKLSTALLPLAMMASANSHPVENENEIVVEKSRGQTKIHGGQWTVNVSRSYRFGKSLDGNNDARALGRELEYSFCLQDTEIETFVRKLVGEGRSDTATTTVCRPMNVRLQDGRVRATQMCEGGNVTIPNTDENTSKTYRTRLAVTVNGKFDLNSLKLDFENRRELIIIDASQLMRPDLMRWTITGERKGECVIKK